MNRFAITRRVLTSCGSFLLLAACHGDDPQVPTTLASFTAAPVSGTAGTALASAPTVTLKDQKGHGIAGVWVHWNVPLNGGHVGNDSSKTDASGLALSGGWTLGPTAGTQTLTATASGLQPTVITAQAAAGPVQNLVVVGNAQTAVVNSAVASAPSVRAVDVYGNSVQGVTVTFIATTGNGSLTGATQVTNADGIATAGSWTLGTLAGDQVIRASTTTNNVAATLTARAIGGAAVSMAIVEGDAQRGSAGKRICVSPTVKVLDVYGNAVGQIPISFTPSSGSGSVAVGTVLTDATTGKAAVGAWTLGSNATQTLVATTTALPGKQLTFTVTTSAAAGYTICARFIGDAGTPRQREAVTKALAKWQTVIVGHVQTTHLTAPAAECVDNIPAINEDIEDLLLYVQLAAIDGPLNIIGQSAPCYLHSSGLTMMGFLQLDIADLDLMLNDGTLDNVVLHEIGHILGIGTLWNVRQHNLLTGTGSSNPFFTGAVARDGFASTGSPYTGTPVPVENSGGAGTRDAHWRRSVFGSELMNGYAAVNMPLSRVTVGSLADLGYTVNLAAADPFSLVPSLIGAIAPTREMPNDVADTPMWVVEKDGTKTQTRIPTVPIRR